MSRKLFPDRREEWGDGGGGVMSYPVWIADRLDAAQGVRAQLARQLRAMEGCQNDVQPNGIVHDIIDPCLHSRLLTKQEHEHILASKKQEDARKFYDDEDEESADANEQAAIQSHEETLRTRGSFQWVPTMVQCSLDKRTGRRSARFLGDVAGLPERSPIVDGLYQSFEAILSAMLPLFAKIDLRGKGRTFDYTRSQQDGLSPIQAPHTSLQNGTLQVVMKVQEYVLPPHSTYSGRWHTEGFSENICAAGVYYLDVSAATTGGSLSFRPPVTPDECYFEFVNEEDAQSEEEEGAGELDEETQRGPAFWQHYIKDVPVQTGTAVVFHNAIPHRFRSIKNDSDEAQRRLFVNFFIVNPEHPLPTTSTSASPQLLRRILVRRGLVDRSVQDYLLQFVGGYSSADFLHRKLIRDQARTAMSRDRPHWFTYMFGNSGDLQYHSDGRSPYYAPECGAIGRNYEHSACPTSNLGSGL